VAKSTTKGKRPPGRPPVSIDEARVVELASNGLTAYHISEVMGVSVDTLRRHFAKLITQKRAEFRAKLAGWQADVAQGKAGPGPRATMLIWLGKQHLDQSDKSQLEHRGEVPINVTVNLTDEK